MMLVVGKRAKHLTLANADFLHRRLCLLERRLGARIPAQDHAVGHGQELRPHRRFRPLDGDGRRVAHGGKGLKIETRLNGKVMQSDNTDNMMFPVAEMLVYVTQGMTLEPGDIIFTGTPSGVGHARKPNPIWMKPGDTCEIEIEGVGVLGNPIAEEK